MSGHACRWLARGTIVLLVAGLLPASAAAERGGAESAFQDGVSRYQEGDYAGAIDAWEGIVREGLVSGPLFYNLGNARFRSGDIAGAILDYERARRWMPGDEDLRHNLELVRRLTVDRIEPLPRPLPWRLHDVVRDALPVGGWAWLAWAGYLLLLGAAAAFRLVRSGRLRRGALAAGAFFLFFTACSGYFLAARRARQARAEGVITAESAPVKSAPGDDGEDAFVLHAGTWVRVEDGVGEWLRVRIADGKTGWMRADALERI